MSCVDSITYTGSAVADLKDLDVDEIKLFKNYKFKDPLDISNNLEIAKFKEKVMYLYFNILHWLYVLLTRIVNVVSK